MKSELEIVASFRLFRFEQSCRITNLSIKKSNLYIVNEFSQKKLKRHIYISC